MTHFSRQIRVGFVVGGVTSSASGLVSAISGLAQGLARAGQDVALYTISYTGRPEINYDLDGSGVRVVVKPAAWLGRLSYSSALKRVFAAELPAVDVIHNHSIWVLPSHHASKQARSLDKPVVYSAHGALEPWALARSYWKKLLVRNLFQDHDLATAACIHALNPREVAGIRSFGLRQPVAVIPNGVDLAPFDSTVSADALENRFPQIKGKKVLLFLSRLHAKKGLAHLVYAWKQLIRDHPDWHLLIVGPDDGEEGALRSQISSEGIATEAISLAGSMNGTEKVLAFAAADAFVLPSFSEGFSMAVLEAMAARLPVIITPGCNFPEAVTSEAAILIEPNAADTERGLRELMSMSDAQRRQMGQRARTLIESQYTWDAAARRMAELYGWILGGGAPPSFVDQ